MNCVAFVLLTVLLYNNVCEGICSDSELGSFDFQFGRRNVINGGNTKITDLNFDVLHLILSDFDWTDLMNVIDAIPTLSPIVSSIFRWKYKDYMIQIMFAESNANRAKLLIDTPRKIIAIYDYETILTVLTLFGHVIQRINIQNEAIDNNRLATISAALNKYGSKTLASLEFVRIAIDTLEQFSVPFQAIQNLTISINDEGFRCGNLPLNQLFPNVRRLVVHLETQVNNSFIDYQYPELEHLTIYAKQAEYVEQHIEDLIRKNSQIKSIELKRIPINFIEFINRQLPALETLVLYELHIESDTLGFDCLKHFELYESSADSIRRLSLPHLQTIKITYSSQDFDDWTHFFGRHQSITKLHLTEYHYLLSEPLVAFTAILTNLVVLTVKSSHEITLQAIIQSIENLPHLKVFRSYNGIDLRLLQERFAEDWNIEAFQENWFYYILLERKEFDADN